MKEFRIRYRTAIMPGNTMIRATIEAEDQDEMIATLDTIALYEEVEVISATEMT